MLQTVDSNALSGGCAIRDGAVVITEPRELEWCQRLAEATQPRAAPVIGAANPSRGGAADGKRRMPLNQTMKAKAVPTMLR